jgi:tetratricopeptide (TPR) repeat protein
VDLYDQGDKLMVVFGAPVAHEQDAQRAALTALAMQKAMGRLSSPLASTLLSQRIGIHTGFVFAGNVGSDVNNRREYTVMGDTVNLAARLMSVAPPGQVWASQRVWDRIQTGFEAQTLPPVKLRGIEHPVPIFQLQAARRIQEDRDWSRILRSEIVGREDELKTLGECLGNLVFGEGKQIVAITGEAGVGKSRLIGEWQRRAAHDSDPDGTAIWLRGRGHSYGQRTHGVIIDIVEQLLGFADTDTPEERWNKLAGRVSETFAGAEPGWVAEFTNRLAYLGHFLALDLSLKQGLAERIEQLEAEVLQVQTRLALCDLVEHTAEKNPLVLILDDLHWADEASLDMLKFLVVQVSDASSVLFCLIYRPQKERQIWQTWHDIERSYPDCHLISLHELGATAGHQLLSNLLQDSQLPEDFEKLILEETDGNPLYVEEVLHTLIETGVLVQEDAVWRLTQSVERIRVPDTLYQIIQSRIDELDFGSPGARRVLWMASVIGEQFTQDLLLHLFTSTGRGKGEFLRHFRELRNAAMIEKVKSKGDDRQQQAYQFRHGLVQQVAYENMLIGKQREYHCRVGRWLEEMHREDLPRHYDALAHHYDRGRLWEKAFQYHWLSGRRDADAFANQDAISHLRRALEIANSIAPGAFRLGEVHFELGKALAVTAAYELAIEHLKQAYDLFGNVPNEAAVPLRARACHHIARSYEQQGGTENLAAALEWQDKGLGLLPETPTAEAAMLHAAGGMVSFRQGDFDRAAEKAELAVSLGEAAGATVELGPAYRLLSVTYHARGNLNKAMEYNRQNIENSEKTSDLVGLAKGYLNQGVYAFEMDDWELAHESYLQAHDLLERIGEEFELARVRCNLGDLYFHSGEIEEGLDYAQRSLDAFTKIDSVPGRIIAGAVLAILLWRRGDLEQARAQLLEAKTLAEGAVVFKPTVGRWLTQVHLTAGDIAEAEAELRELESLDTDMLADDAEPIQRLAGQVLVARGERDEGIRVLQESLERLEQNDMRYQAACTHLTLARVQAHIEGRETKAREHAEHARAIFADLGARLDRVEAESLIAEIGERSCG